jgi:tRNA A37 threonylcarbamoyladenosine dehydratase
MVDLYDRQRPLDLAIPSCITIAGLGGIGSWVAILSAMSGVPNIYLFDPDTLEEHNRNRLPFCQGNLNMYKVDIVANYIRAIRPDCVVVAVHEKLDGVLLQIQLSVSRYVFDCTDSPKSQFMLYTECKKKGVNFIRAGYDGTHITVSNIVSGWIKTDTENEDYTIRPSWVVPAVTVAALAVGKMMKYPNQDVSLDISEIGNPVMQRTKRLTQACKARGA